MKNKKKIEELEKRIAALEANQFYPYVPYYPHYPHYPYYTQPMPYDGTWVVTDDNATAKWTVLTEN